MILRTLDGAFPVEEAFQDPQAGALSEYIGKEDVTCDYTRMPFLLQPEDALLLCSDGLSNVVTEQEVLYEVLHGGPAEDCCRRLLDIALLRGAPDNVTAVLLQM